MSPPLPCPSSPLPQIPARGHSRLTPLHSPSPCHPTCPSFAASLRARTAASAPTLFFRSRARPAGTKPLAGAPCA
eukprot:1058320-Pleurochrysis_carterae.AAC.1